MHTNKPSFAIIPFAALSSDIGDDGALRVYCVLLGYAMQAGTAWPSIATLADDCRCTPKSVTRRLKKLEEAGWITRTRRFADNGAPRSTVYTLHMRCTVSVHERHNPPAEQCRDWTPASQPPTGGSPANVTGGPPANVTGVPPRTSHEEDHRKRTRIEEDQRSTPPNPPLGGSIEDEKPASPSTATPSSMKKNKEKVEKDEPRRGSRDWKRIEGRMTPRKPPTLKEVGPYLMSFHNLDRGTARAVGTEFLDYFDSAAWKDTRKRPVANWMFRLDAWVHRDFGGRIAESRRAAMDPSRRQERML